MKGELRAFYVAAARPTRTLPFTRARTASHPLQEPDDNVTACWRAVHLMNGPSDVIAEAPRDKYFFTEAEICVCHSVTSFHQGAVERVARSLRARWHQAPDGSASSSTPALTQAATGRSALDGLGRCA